MKDQKAVLALLKITFYGFRSVILDALDAAKVPPCIRAVNEINKMMAKDQFAE